eukprot:401053-Pleurochrysis_carterae.AAC.3
MHDASLAKIGAEKLWRGGAVTLCVSCVRASSSASSLARGAVRVGGGVARLRERVVGPPACSSLQWAQHTAWAHQAVLNSTQRGGVLSARKVTVRQVAWGCARPASGIRSGADRQRVHGHVDTKVERVCVAFGAVRCAAHLRVHPALLALAVGRGRSEGGDAQGLAHRRCQPAVCPCSARPLRRACAAQGAGASAASAPRRPARAHVWLRVRCFQERGARAANVPLVAGLAAVLLRRNRQPARLPRARAKSLRRRARLRVARCRAAALRPRRVSSP